MTNGLVNFAQLFNIRDNLDLTCACVGSVLSIILGVLSFLSSNYLLAAIMLLSLVAFIVYMVLRKFGKLAGSLNDIPRSSVRLPVLLDGLFLCLIAVCVAVYFTRPLLMERPLLFFILTSLAVGVLAVKIYLSPDSRRHRLITLAEIVVVGLGLKLSVLGLYSSIVGIDPWVHLLYAEKLKETWDFAIVYGWPVMPTIAALGLLGGLTYKAVTMFLFIPIQVFGDVILIYLIGKELFNSRIGMLASLLLMVAGWYVFFGYWVIPSTLAVTFVLASIYMFVKAHKNRSWRYLVGAFVFLVIAAHTHPIPIIWLWALLGIFLCGMLVYRFLYREQVKISRVVMITCAMSVAVPLILWGIGTTRLWSVVSGINMVWLSLFPKTHPSAVSELPVGLAPSVPSAVSELPVGLAPSVPSAVSELPVGLAPSVPSVVTVEPILKMQNMLDNAHFPEYLFNYVGIVIFFALALIGALYMVSRKHGNLYSFTLGVGGIFTAILSFLPQQIFSGILFSDRGCYLGQIIMAIPLAIALVLIVRAIPKQVFRLLAIGLAVGSICFLSVIGLPANEDTDIISKNQIVRYGFSQKELDAARWAWVNTDGVIGLDPQYACALLLPDLVGGKEGGGRVECINLYLADGDFSKCNSSIVLIRNEIVNKPFGWGDGKIYRLTYDPRDVLLNQGWYKAFDNGEVSGFKRQ